MYIIQHPKTAPFCFSEYIALAGDHLAIGHIRRHYGNAPVVRAVRRIAHHGVTAHCGVLAHDGVFYGGASLHRGTWHEDGVAHDGTWLHRDRVEQDGVFNGRRSTSHPSVTRQWEMHRVRSR